MSYWRSQRRMLDMQKAAAQAAQLMNHQAIHNQMNQLQQYQAAQMQQALNNQLGAQAAPPALKARDQFGEDIGYRAWRLVMRPILTSVHMTQHIWMPGKEEEADAKVNDYGSHGFHAWNSRDRCLNYAVDTGPPLVLGSVRLWGDVISHESGYRAQFARIQTLDLVLLDVNSLASESRLLRTLRAYYGVQAEH